MGDISSDQIYDKPGKKDKSFLVNNADASSESGIPLYLAAEPADNSNVELLVNNKAIPAETKFYVDPITKKYIISDPTGVRERGYVDPATGQPYPSSQPYLGNLLEAFKDDTKDSLSKTYRPNNNFDKRDMKF